jgi:hypothetical protein
MNANINEELVVNVNTNNEVSGVSLDTRDAPTSQGNAMNSFSYTPTYKDQAQGLCAETEEELPFVFRTTLWCFDEWPCPQGLWCFSGMEVMNADAQDDFSTMNTPSYTETTPYVSLDAPANVDATLSVVPYLFISMPVKADDTLSEEEPDDAYGIEPKLAVGGGLARKLASSILKFDVSFIRTGVTIVDIKMRLFVLGEWFKMDITGTFWVLDWAWE